MIRISDISEKGFVNKSVVRYNGHENLEKFKIIPQDILIAMTGGTVGKSLFVQQMDEDMLLNQRIAIIRNNGQYAPYIDIVVKSPHIKSFINDKKNSTNDNISMGDINSFLVPLPPFAEQKRIVAKLEELLPIVEQYGKAQKELDELNATLPARLRQSILQEAISGRLVPQDPNDEPAAVLLQRIREEKARLVKEGKLKKKDLVETPITDDEKPFEIPASWEWCRVQQVIKVKSGDGLNVRSLNDKAQYPVYGGNGINGTYHQYNVEADTLVIGRVGFYCGAVHKTYGKAWVTDNALIVSFVKTGIFVDFLKYVLTWLKIRRTSNSTAQPVVSGKGIYPLIFPLPPLAEQKRIVAKIEELFAEIDKMK